jgi:hypothetical protein
MTFTFIHHKFIIQLSVNHCKMQVHENPKIVTDLHTVVVLDLLRFDQLLELP